MINTLIYIKTLVYQPVFLTVNSFTKNELIIKEAIQVDTLLVYLIPFILCSFKFKNKRNFFSFIKMFSLLRIFFILLILIINIYFNPELIACFFKVLPLEWFQTIILAPLLISYWFFGTVYKFSISSIFIVPPIYSRYSLIVFYTGLFFTILGALKLFSKNSKYDNLSILPIALFLIRCFGVAIIGFVFIVITISELGNELGLLTRAGAQIGECGL